MAKKEELSEVEIAWLIAWNVAAGYWSQIGLNPGEAKTLMVDFAHQLRGNPLEAAKQSRVRLQQALMALRKDGFEEIQAEAPFRPHAQQNMRRLLVAYEEAGETGIAEAWHEIFRMAEKCSLQNMTPFACWDATVNRPNMLWRWSARLTRRRG